MASGKSRRFNAGHGTDLQQLSESGVSAPQSFRNKLLADFHGRPLLASVLDTVSASPIFEKITVTRTEQIKTLCDTLCFPCLLHSRPYLSDTIRLGLEALLLNTSSSLDGCIFLQGDQPLLSPESIEALILAFRQEQRFVYRLSWNGVSGSPVLFPQKLFSELLALPPDQGGSFVIRRHPELVRTVEARSPHELLDADTPEALEYLRMISAP